ncbi:MAB_1171c family putative transporter [Saccharopolyspora sp. MS10]|uniref:MAB_1171c family putative transporter n=1 Tax=Saccharopolyspora sp. MS10 TaxID=3385973 RepID=UPI0039A088D5
MFAVVYSLALLLQLGAFLWKLRDFSRDPRDPRLGAITLALLFVACGFNFALPGVYLAVGAASGIPNLSTLAVYSSIVLCTASLQVCSVNLSRSREAAVPAGRTLVLGTATALLVMAVLFALAPVHDAPHVLDFDAHYAGEPAIAAFLAVYLGAYSLGLVRSALICLRIRPHAGDRWLRWGVSLVPVGVVFGLGYSVLKAVAVAATWLGGDLAVVSTVVAPLSATIGASVMAIGYVLPSAPRLLRYWRARRNLRPLLRALRPLDPALMRNTRLESAEYRWLVATHDLLRELRPYLDPAVVAVAVRHADRAGLTGDERAAAIEAARIAAGLRAHEAGHRPGSGSAMIREDVGVDGAEAAVWRFPDQDPRRDLAEELRWSCLIGAAFRGPHPVVRDVLAELGPVRPTAGTEAAQ